MVGLCRFSQRICNTGVLILLFVFAGATKGQGQDRCGTVEYTKMLLEKNLIRDGDRKFEKWLSQRKKNISSRISAAASFKIPVVVHVIHNGEAVGSGSNISDAQIASQIKVLNNDFKRLNADTSDTPSEFLLQAGKINLEFVLAKQSPDGVPTNGILRVKGTKSQWTMNDNNMLKSQSYWRAEDYLNIWVTDIASSILGYAQFPVSALPGLEDAETNRLTDGVVLDYRIVGSNQDGSFNLTTEFYRGRTATHEVGHFFGLRHIWGDDDGACTGAGDYVDDTPNQGNSSDGCPSHPLIGCNVKTMFQNYMDYTNDACMNLYTKQQVERMLTVLENSPRRASLLSSQGLYDPTLVNDDLAIKEIRSPSTNACSGPVVPSIVVKNNGLNPVTSAKIQLTVGTTVIETKIFNFSGLGIQQSAEISFAPFTLPPGNSYFHFEILETNNATDGKPVDNARTVVTAVPDDIATPFSENFNSLPANWTVINADQEATWATVETGAVNNSVNKAIYMKFFQGQEEAGEIDVITTPVIDLTHAPSPFLAFDVAYGRYQNHSDGLEVYVLLDCGTDLSASDKIYSKYGSALATVPSTTSSFLPSNESQWRREVIDLTKYVGQDRIQLAFVGVNDGGNNLYVDNIAARTDVTENIAIRQLTYPSPVHCSKEIQPVLLVENIGNLPIAGFKVEYFANLDAIQIMSTRGDFNLPPGEQTTITLPALTLKDGENRISFELTQPNGFKDVDVSDNKLQVKTMVDASEDKIPLRKNFDVDIGESAWQIINPMGSRNWETTSTNYDQSLYFEGDDNSSEQEYAWFVSPVLDFSDAVAASLFFDLSFQHKSIDSIKDPSEEVFKVLASVDCGKTFDEVLFSSNGSALSEGSMKAEFAPSSASDWKHTFLNLNSLVGEESIRIAFVVSGKIAKSIYLDNIEFFLSDDPLPFSTTELYALYPSKIDDVKSFYVTFNLNSRQPVVYELIDMAGKQVGSKELSDVLNQTYKIDIEDTSSGIYLVRLLIDKKYYVSRILVIP